MVMEAGAIGPGAAYAGVVHDLKPRSSQILLLVDDKRQKLARERHVVGALLPLGAGDVLKLAKAAEPAVLVDASGVAAQRLALRARRVVVARLGWIVGAHGGRFAAAWCSLKGDVVRGSRSLVCQCGGEAARRTEHLVQLRLRGEVLRRRAR